MALTLTALRNRVQVEGKDSNSQYTTEIESYIKDTTRELTTSLDWRWLIKSDTVTLASGWINLPTDFKKVMMCMYSNKALQYLKEEDYFQQAHRLDSSQAGYNKRGFYRLRYNAGLWQIQFVNLPTTGTVDLLYVGFTDDVTTVPDILEEAIFLGATGKFMRFMEGDDLAVATKYEKASFTKAEQLHGYMDMDVYSVEPDRVKTNQEIEQEALYYDETS